MPYNDSNISKSIFYSALVGEFLIITKTHSSLLYKDFNEKAVRVTLYLELKNLGAAINMCVNRMKAQGRQSLRCRKARSKII